MVDPNPARGMPIQFQKYWLAGKGAAKIRWNIPGDFKRCVHQLIKYFPKNPEGLCNILHTKATGGPPGHGSAEKGLAIIAAAGYDEAQALLDAQPEFGPMWAGPLAPINRPTMEPFNTRVFEPGALGSRALPLPLDWRKVKSAQGHSGSVTVGRILGLSIGPGPDGTDYLWGFGDWLAPEIIPEVTAARYLVQKGVAGASLDPGGPVVGEMNPDTGFAHMSQYVMGGATLVSIPAFSGMSLVDGEYADDDHDGIGAMPFEDDLDYATEDCGCDGDYSLTAAVNSTGWRGLPLAPREAVFDNDDAVKRISQWSQNDPKMLGRMFMWRDHTKPEGDPTSYRLPFGDIISGKPTLVYHAVYAAAALLSGAHGGLPNVPDEEKAQLRSVISEIYPELASAFNDSSIRAPWDQPADVAAREQGGVTAAMTAPAEPYGDVKYADPGYRDSKKRYPIDTPEHIRAAWSYINQEKNAGMYDAKQLADIKARIMAAAKKAGIQISDSEMSVDLTFPPRHWFDNPELSAKTPLTITSDGRVFGHLAAWNECHRDFNKSCVLAPRSKKNYEPFHLGTVFTAEGDSVRVGKIVMDTRHAGINLGYRAAAIHYDNTGDEVAVVRAGEDEFGIWVAGAVVPEADQRKVQKLRRSPISGDWRAVDGHLELTAALAVNVPAFPVFSMDGDDRLALVAAGTIYPEDTDIGTPMVTYEESREDDFVEEYSMSDEEAQEERAWDLRAIDEDHANWDQWNRARELYEFAVATGAEHLPANPGEDPLYGDQAVLARQMDTAAPYHVMEDTGAGTVPTPTA
jgi:hypothetical protein